jgi:hypothetical protein
VRGLVRSSPMLAQRGTLSKGFHPVAKNSTKGSGSNKFCLAVFA